MIEGVICGIVGGVLGGLFGIHLPQPRYARWAQDKITELSKRFFEKIFKTNLRDTVLGWFFNKK